jgi:hypothetical protein
MRKALTLLTALAALTACGTVSAATGGDVKVVYTLESDAPTMLATYATASGGSIGQQQDNNVKSPWTKTITAKDSFAKSFVLSGVMNPVTTGGKDGTKITCRITVDGKKVAEQTSTGQYASVTCTAS